MIDRTILKIAGTCLVVCGTTFSGYLRAKKIKEQIMLRKSLYKLLLHIKKGISGDGMGLKEIYSSFDSAFPEKTGFLDILKSDRENPLNDALETVRTYLPEELYNIYQEFSENLGKSRSGECEVQLILRYEDIILKKEESYIQKDETEIQLCKKLGLLAGIIAAIVFI